MADVGPAPAPPSRRWSGWRYEGWALVEVFALCGFVVVQPLLQIMGDSPDFFIFHRVGGGGVLALVAVLVVVPPVVLWGLGAAVGLVGRRPRRVAHLVTLGVLLGLFAAQVGKHLDAVGGIPLAALALLVAAVATVACARLGAIRQLLRFAAVGPPVFALLFTLASPSSAVVFAGGDRVVSEVPETGPHPPVVVLVLDEFPLVSLLGADGGVDAARFPHFARLAGESTWYRNATGMAGWTPYALPAMLSGREPAAHVAPHYSQHPENLFTLLGEVYRIHASESISELCPPWYCGDLAARAGGGLPEVLAESADLWWRTVSPRDAARDPYADFVEETVAERLGAGAAAAQAGPEFRFDRVADNQPARFQDFLAALAASPPTGASGSAGAAAAPSAGGTGVAAAAPGAVGGAAPAPSLHFLHLLLPHTPWTYLPSGTRYHHVPGLPVDGQWWSRLALQRHELQLQYTDRLLGAILRLLEETERYDDTLLVVTADHGVSLTPGTAGRELDASDRAATELAWVPLFIKAPGQDAGVVDDRNWQHVDLLPTLADLAGFEVPWPTDGISAVREERAGTDKVYYNALEDRRVLDGPAHFALIRDDPTSIPAVPEAPLPGLVGRPVADLPVTDGDVRATVDHVERFDEVDPALLPALVHGTLSGQVAEGTALAIAVNGRIGAVAPVVAGEGGARFAGLVETESLFVAGANTLELFLVTDDGSALQRVSVS